MELAEELNFLKNKGSVEKDLVVSRGGMLEMDIRTSNRSKDHSIELRRMIEDLEAGIQRKNEIIK